MARPPMAATSARILAACPFKRPSSATACCAWPDFVDGFADSWPRYMDGEPTAEQWAAAKRDWTRGNTGWEAVQNAKLRAREAERAAAEPPLVRLGGRNYTHAGSALHLRFLAAQPPQPGDSGMGDGGGRPNARANLPATRAQQEQR